MMINWDFLQGIGVGLFIWFCKYIISEVMKGTFDA
jgi:hypothetical protein